MNKQEIIKKIERQKESLFESPLKNPKERVRLLKKLRANIIQMQDEILDALKKDLNKSSFESYMCEVGMVLEEISYMIKNIKKFAKPVKVKTPIAQFPSKSYALPCAYGQVLIISPWNYPFMLGVDPLVNAIAAGNSVVIKPSETSANTQKVIEKLMKNTFDETEVLVVMGGRTDCDFLLKQNWDYIFFTGSTRVGKTILKAAAEHYTPVTLEMGGKSPCIVEKDANIELSAKRIIFGKCLNAGQTCVAPDFIFCHESVKEKLVEELKKQINLQYSSLPLENEKYPKLVSEKQFEYVKSLLDKKRILFGGKFDESALKIEPTIMDSDFEKTEMQEEIFGPILPIVTFSDSDEAIKVIRNKAKPLAFYVFAESKELQNKWVESCDFGGGCINDTIIHLATTELGFGGVKESGMGAYHGKVGFDTFTHYKSIVNKKTWLDINIRYQPSNEKKEKLLRKFMK